MEGGGLKLPYGTRGLGIVNIRAYAGNMRHEWFPGTIFIYGSCFNIMNGSPLYVLSLLSSIFF